MEDRQTVTASEALKMLGISRSQLARLIKSKRLEAYKLTPGVRNSPYRIYLDSLDAFLKQRQQSSV